MAARLTEDERQRLMGEFYDELVSKHPQLASHFSTLNLAQQVRKLSATLQTLVAFADDPRTLGVEVIRLGIKHSQRGIGSSEYRLFATTLASVLARSQTIVRYERARRIWLVELKAITVTMALVDNA
jgi:hemoglobin-like flavoprotein